MDIGGDIIIVSQFTLYGDCRKGRRPSFIEALGGEEASILYNKFVESIKKEVKQCSNWRIWSRYESYIENDGPVTILLDSRKTF